MHDFENWQNLKRNEIKKRKIIKKNFYFRFSQTN